MSAQAYRRLLIITIVLGMIAGLWFLPRGFSFGSTVPPQPIELRSTPVIERTVSPEPARGQSVDDDEVNDDDGADDRDDDGDDDGRTSRRADLRGGQVDTPASAERREMDDDDADDADDAGDDDDDDGPDDQDDDDD